MPEQQANGKPGFRTFPAPDMRVRPGDLRRVGEGGAVAVAVVRRDVWYTSGLIFCFAQIIPSTTRHILHRHTMHNISHRTRTHRISHVMLLLATILCTWESRTYHISRITHTAHSIHHTCTRAAESESRPELESVEIDRFGYSRSWSWSR